jgi:hypothetical protein
MLAATRFIRASRSDVPRRSEMNLKAMAVVASGVVASIASGDAVQWRVEDGGNGHWYRFNSSHVDWQSARAAALEQGGDLACITTSGENAFVRNLIPPGDAGYLGGIRVPDGSEVPWRWVSGESWSYVKWNPGEPNGNTAGEVIWLERDSGGWNDHTQDFDIQGALIEWSADCNNDGIVDYGQCRDGSLPDFNGNNIPDCCEQGTACTVGSYPVEWRVADGGNGHWYDVRSSGFPPFDARNWQVLQDWAAQHGAELCSIGAAVENAFVQLQLQSRFPSGESWSYLGATQDASQSCSASAWLWLDGTPWSFQNWQAGQPNCLSTGGVLDEPRLAIRNSSGSWGDWSAKELTTAVIEWSADCNNDGIVDYGQILRGELADTNANGVPDICDPCVADIVQDGLVNGIDLAAVLNNWGTKGGVIDADVNNDGIVDGSDLSIVLNGWGACP